MTQFSNQAVIDNQANKFLGKTTNDYSSEYNPDILVAIERDLNRIDFGINKDEFVGYDIWHNYECSFMTNKGYPISLVGKIKIPADSKYFIESKSMKLYFFSLHMERLGESVDEAIQNYVELVTRDLSLRTESSVEFEVYQANTSGNIFSDYVEIEDLVDVDDINFNHFKENPDLLVKSDNKDTTKIIFKNVRSNCRVTHQPDFANLYLVMKGEQPTLESVLEYIVSFRNEFHFHEEVTEQIFHNIKTRFDIEELGVNMLFTRRGGLDICPCRATSDELLDEHFSDIQQLPLLTVYQ